MEEEAYLELREWSPLIDLLEKIPATRAKSLIQKDVINITCIHAVEEFIAVGTNVGSIYWYNRAKKDLKEFRCDSSPLTCIRIVSTVEFLIAAGDRNGNVYIYQLQKELSDEILNLGTNLVQKPDEKYSVRGVHKGAIKCLEWSKNGMKLFSGDKLGLIVLTEFDFPKHESRSSEIFNEAYEIVQLRFEQKRLLASSIFRTVICEPSTVAGGQPWRVCQVGKKDRKLLSICGATFVNSDHRASTIVCVRPGGRMWIADVQGNVDKTMVFKDIFEARRPEVVLINPSRRLMKISNEFELVYPFMKDYCVTFNKDAVFVLNLKKNRVEATVKYLRAVYDVAVNNQEIFVLEGPRTIIRIAPDPDPHCEVRSSVFMARSSFTNGLDLRGLTSVYESPLDENSGVDVTNASECQELPPIEHLDVEKLLQESFSGPSTEEHLRKLEKFNEINEETFDNKILFKSRRLRVQEALSPSDIRPRGSGIVEIAQLVTADDEVEEKEMTKEAVAMQPLHLDVIVLNEEQSISNYPADSTGSSRWQSDERDRSLPEVFREKDLSPDPDFLPHSPVEPDEENCILSQILNYTVTNFCNEDEMQELWTKKSGENSEITREILEAAFLSEVRDIPNTEIDLVSSASSNSTSRQNSSGSALSSDWEIVENIQ